MKRSVIISLTIAIIFAACNRTDRSTDNPEYRPIELGRLDIATIQSDSAAFFALTPGADRWLAITGSNPQEINHFFDKAAAKPYNADVMSQWSATDSLCDALGLLTARAKALDIVTSNPGFYAVVSPYNQSVITADSLIFIALNHYLGAGKDYYAYFPDYIRRLKEPSRIGIDVATAMVTKAFPFTFPDDYPTALARMAYEGAVTEAVMQLTGASEQDVIGFSDDDYAWLLLNEQQAWTSLIIRDMIFSTDPAVVDGLVRQNAVTSVLHHESPGMAGRFIGHRIISSYLKSHPETPVSTLLSPDFYASENLLTSAAYEGK